MVRLGYRCSRKSSLAGAVEAVNAWHLCNNECIRSLIPTKKASGDRRQGGEGGEPYRKNTYCHRTVTLSAESMQQAAHLLLIALHPLPEAVGRRRRGQIRPSSKTGRRSRLRLRPARAMPFSGSPWGKRMPQPVALVHIASVTSVVLPLLPIRARRIRRSAI